MSDFQKILDLFDIKFEPLTHVYTRGKRVIPSVNQIIDKVLGNSFKTKNLYVRQAGDKGTLIHKKIHDFILHNVEPSFYMPEFENFLKLSNEHNLTWDMSEQIIFNIVEDMEYCGTLDLYSSTSKELTDIKTGSTKQLKKWQRQLSLYADALECLFGLKVERASIFWLHGEEAEYIPIKLLETKEIIDFLKEYYSPNINNQKEEKTLKKHKSKRSSKC